MVCLLREKNQLEQVQICSQLEIILTFSRKYLFYRIFTLPNFTLLHGELRSKQGALDVFLFPSPAWTCCCRVKFGKVNIR